MKCPKCDKSDMPTINHHGVDFNICSPGCKGIWCEKGELAYYLETVKDTAWKHDLKATGQFTDLNCPSCADSKLKHFPYIEGGELLLDICPNCEGVFLDFKELAEVARLSITIDQEGKLQRSIQDLMKLTGNPKD